MIWLTWRQFRAQFLAGAALLVAVAAYLLWLGLASRHAYTHDILGCSAPDGCNVAFAVQHFADTYTSLFATPDVVLMAVPAIIGVFWGTPLITRELEANTHRLVWNQSITRTRWLAVKLSLVGLVSVASVGALSLLLTWAASRFDQVVGGRFDPLSFPARNVAPLGYAAFAFVLGTTVGLFVRRTVAAMALTLLVVGVAQLLVPSLARAHLRPPVVRTIAYAEAAKQAGASLAITRDGPEPVMEVGYTETGALMLDDNAALRNAAGTALTMADVQSCMNQGPSTQQASGNGLDTLETCVSALNVHFEVSLQPANRYWSFQWIEFGEFTVLAAALAGVAFWRIRRVRG